MGPTGPIIERESSIAIADREILVHVVYRKRTHVMVNDLKISVARILDPDGELRCLLSFPVPH